jgi:serine/threonine-protein kinase
MAVPMSSAMMRAEARIGSVLVDKWRLDKLLGVGGMAAVYSATHRNKKRAAIKMLHPEVSLDLAVRERFLREGYVANSVGHAGAVAVDDDDVAEDGSAFLVMELLDGETVDARWQRKSQRLSPIEVLSVADQVLDTLAAAHEKGIVHRDIKPENLFLTREGSIKILDFGIARVLEWQSSRASATQTGSTMGTPAYMAPEQARGRWNEVDPRTDLWALGATMYTLLTGEFVHGAGTVNEMLALAVTRPARKISSLRPDLHPALAEVVDKALAYKKQDRWADARSMQNAVRITYATLEGHDLQSAPQLSLPQMSEVVSSLPEFVSTPDQATLTTARGLASADMPTVTSMNLRRTRQWSIVGLVAVLAAIGMATGIYLSRGERASDEVKSPTLAAAVPNSEKVRFSSATSANSAINVVPEVRDVPAAPAAPPAADANAEPKVLSPSKAAASKSTAAPALKRPSVVAPAAPAAPAPKKNADPFARRR